MAARALGITLTKRGKHQGEDIPMCGVPVHAADDYLQKLIGQGYRVAVCEQVEDPAEAKKRGSKSVVKRDVVRLVTPGTITEEKLLAPSEANYLMALGRTKGDARGGERDGAAGNDGNLALAWIDISTGAFRVCRTSAGRLLTDILRVDPREVILADAVFHEPELRPTFDVIGRLANPQPAILFDSSAATGRIARFYDVATPDSFGEFSRAELSAIAGAIAYVEKTQISERPPLGFPEREEEGTSLFIDAATRANLELLKTLSGSREGSLLKAIDRTVTGGGARLLADRLMSPLTDPVAINARLDGISFLISEPRLCESLRAILKGAPDMPRALSRLALNRGGPRDMGALRAGLDAARQASDLLRSAMLPAELVEACEALSALPTALTSHLGAALSDELPLLKRDGGFVAKGYDGELDQMRALRDDTRRVIAGMERDLCEETGIRSLKIRHNNVLGYYIEVTAQNSGALTEGDAAKARFIHRQTMANAMRFTTTELAELETKIANAADRALQIEFGVFDRLLAEIVGHADALRKGAAALAAIDVATSLAVLAEQENYARPQVDDGLAFAIEGGRHPVVEQALRRQLADPFVANDCDLSPADGDETWRDLAPDRPEHGRQVDLPAPERADRDPRADGLLRAGATSPYRRRRPAVLPRRRVRRSGARPLDLHGRDGRDGGDPQPGGRARACHPRRDRARHLDLRRPVDRLGGGRVSAREERLPRDLRHPFPRDDGAVGEAGAPRQRHHEGEGVGRRRRLPARGRQGRGRSLLWRPGGQARRPARCGRGARACRCSDSSRRARRAARRPSSSTTCRSFPSRRGAPSRSRRPATGWPRNLPRSGPTT